MKKTKKGFTLIELIVVLAILAVIGAIAVPTAFGAIDNARIAADTASIDGFNGAIRMQTAFLMANPDDTVDTVAEAFKVGAMTEVNAQTTTSVYFFDAATNSPAHFVYVKKGETAPTGATAVSIVAGAPLKAALETVAGGKALIVGDTKLT